MIVYYHYVTTVMTITTVIDIITTTTLINITTMIRILPLLSPIIINILIILCRLRLMRH